jgi:hypothetical protein
MINIDNYEIKSTKTGIKSINKEITEKKHGRG